MEKLTLNHSIYKDFYILTKKEFANIGKDYKSKSIEDNTINCCFLPGNGTILFFENMHFLIINESEKLLNYAIWREHKIIGYCNITEKAAEKANKASNAIFYFRKVNQ